VEQNKKPFNNISTLVSPNGELVWEYRKSFLQPTVEAPIINAGNFEMPVTETQYGKIGSVICSDLDMQHYMKQAGEKEVDILLVPAFDWEGITPLHSQMAKVQAIQFGLAIVRANGMGLSAVYDHMGTEITSLNTFNSDENIMLAELPVHSVITIYSKIGDVFIVLCLAFIIFMVGNGVIRFRRSKKD
jgi:apolipoprotein N-acyltransferase